MRRPQKKPALTIRIAITILVVSFMGLTLSAQQRETEQSQSAHHREMMKRGHEAMVLEERVRDLTAYVESIQITKK